MLTLTCRFRSNLNLEALYLLGDFGVVLHGKDSVLVELPETLSLGDISKQGFPLIRPKQNLYHVTQRRNHPKGTKLSLIHI